MHRCARSRPRVVRTTYSKARGVKRGRKPELSPHQQKEARRRDRGEAVREIARTYNVSHSTICNLAIKRTRSDTNPPEH